MAEITGLNDLKKKLKANCDLSDVKQVVKHNGASLQMKAQRKAPVDTGNLKGSIELDIEDGEFTARVKATAEYAPYVEYGTRYMEAQPYVKPAHNEQKEKFKSDLQKLMR